MKHNLFLLVTVIFVSVSFLLFSCGNRKASVEETACDSVEV